MKTRRKFNGEIMKVFVVKKNGKDVKYCRNIAAAMRFAGMVGGSVGIMVVDDHV